MLRCCSTILKLSLNKFKCKTFTKLHKKWSFSLRISSVNVTNPQETVNLVTFTEEIFNGKLQFLCMDLYFMKCSKNYTKNHCQCNSTWISLTFRKLHAFWWNSKSRRTFSNFFLENNCAGVSPLVKLQVVGLQVC